MGRFVVLMGILGLMGLSGAGVAHADFERQVAGRQNRLVPPPAHERVTSHRKVADFNRGRRGPATSTAVPELDPNAAPVALALLIGAAALVAERRRRRA